MVLEFVKVDYFAMAGRTHVLPPNFNSRDPLNLLPVYEKIKSSLSPEQLKLVESSDSEDKCYEMRWKTAPKFEKRGPGWPIQFIGSTCKVNTKRNTWCVVCGYSAGDPYPDANYCPMEFGPKASIFFTHCNVQFVFVVTPENKCDMVDDKDFVDYGFYVCAPHDVDLDRKPD